LSRRSALFVDDCARKGNQRRFGSRCVVQYPCPESDAAILVPPFLKSRYVREPIPGRGESFCGGPSIARLLVCRQSAMPKTS
jgi:hypothetical protein